MCIPRPNADESRWPPGPPYHCSKLNDSTHLIVNNDKYIEFPYIYVKTYPPLSLAVLVDTGCGIHNRRKGKSALELRDFILSDVLSSGQTSYKFLVICTHCHFDHIGAIEAFANSGAKVVASGHDRAFLLPGRREENSLCGAFGAETPQYDVSHYAEDGEELQHDGVGLGLRFLHTPGHTPDSMAVYDEAERWLFVGDTCYQRDATVPWGEDINPVPIILPLHGDWKDFIASLHKLRSFVTQTEAAFAAESADGKIQLAGGHTTSQVPAGDFLRSVIAFCEGIVSGDVPEFTRSRGDDLDLGGSLGEEIFVLWTGGEETNLSLLIPETFMADF